MSAGDQVLSSLHTHPLTILERDGWSCDGARTKGGCESTGLKPAGPRRYHCAQGCNWDLCEKCLAVTTSAPLEKEVEVTIHPHPLTILDRGGWSCDGASVKGGCESTGSKPSGVVRYHCSQGCNWDLCDKCVAFTKKGDAVADAAASSSGSEPPLPAPGGPSPDYSVGRARLRDAKGIFYREELYKNAMDAAWTQAGRETDRSCPDYIAFLQEYNAVKQEYEAYLLNKKIEDAVDWVNRKLSYAKSQPLSWKERVYETYTEVRKRFEELRSDPVLSSQEQIVQIIATTEVSMLAHEDDIMAKTAADKLNDDKGYVTRQLKYARDQGLRFLDRVHSTHAE